MGRTLPCGPTTRPNISETAFTTSQTHGLAKCEHCDVAVTSDDLGWSSVYVSRQREYPHTESFDSCPHPMVSFALNGPVPVLRTVHGVAVERELLPGSFGIVPAGAPFDTKVDSALESVHVYVHRNIVDEVRTELSDGAAEVVELAPRFAAFDSVLEQLAMGIYEAALEPLRSSTAYVDHLARAFAARLVQNHSSGATKSSRTASASGLNQQRLKILNDFIEDNLAGPLSLADLARQCGVSPGHFARIFKKSVGVTPYQYVLRCRVERAKRLLAETKAPVSSIAYECGFAHQVHLSQVFRRLTGTTPAAYRKNGAIP